MGLRVSRVSAVPGGHHLIRPSVQWWESRWYGFVLILFSIIPLIWPTTPPLPDLPGHMGRYTVELELDHSDSLQRFFDFHWALVGNLGVDLLVIPLTKLVGLEMAVKVIVTAIPALTTAGLLWISHEVHGRFSPATAFAVPFVYGFPFAYGFVNFTLSAGLALLAFAYWLRLTRTLHFRLRSTIFIPISCLIWVTHVFGWGILGLLAFSEGLVRLRAQRASWPTALQGSIGAVLPLAVPILLMIAWRYDSGGRAYTGGFFDPIGKSYSFVGVLRDRWLIWDSLSVAAVVVALWAAFRQTDMGYSRRMLIPAVVLALTFILLPTSVFGSAYADTRIAPFAFMMGILAISSSNSSLSNAYFAAFAAAFALLRLSGTSLSYYLSDVEAQERLTALKYIDRGARVLTLTGEMCPREWELPRYLHLGSFVILRRHGFSNDQWQTRGAQLITVKYTDAKPFDADPSMFVYTRECIKKAMELSKDKQPAGRTIDEAFKDFPRKAFDYVWLLKPPGAFNPPTDLSLLWQGKDSSLYRVVDASSSGQLVIGKPRNALSANALRQHR